jgi:hypothetical protein
MGIMDAKLDMSMCMCPVHAPWSLSPRKLQHKHTARDDPQPSSGLVTRPLVLLADQAHPVLERPERPGPLAASVHVHAPELLQGSIACMLALTAPERQAVR